MNGINLNDPVSVANPDAYWAKYRSDGPIQWSEAHRSWVILSHLELSEAFRDGTLLSTDRVTPLERVAANRPSAFQQVVELLSGWMIFRDPPIHTHLRDPMRHVFTPRKVLTLEKMVTAVVRETVVMLPDEIDVRRDLAGPLPALIIANLLGVNSDDLDQFCQWSDDLATIVFATDPHLTPPELAMDAASQFQEFFGALIDRERKQPSGTLLTALVDGAGTELSDLELVGACTLILFAGHETTSSFLMNTLGLLAQDPHLLSLLRSANIERAVEELFRVIGPTRSMYRKVAKTHTRHGQKLAANENVLLCVEAANHDPLVFENPGTIDFSRKLNPHLSFGWGLHHCLGAHLARLEARVILEAVLERAERFIPLTPVPPIEGTVIASIAKPLRIRFE
ncbi:MAG: cytochrome P450 [Actinomycetota bacterium]|nr:cytochrome P450 [Acidimicrobiales bacterium]